MSNTNKTNFTCRDKYFNYGSYLRSRGYDKEFCNLVNDIQSGNIPIGPIIPGNCPSTTTTINNNVTINECPTLANSGILNITGGDIGLSTTTTDNLSTLLIKSNNFSLQPNKGIKNLGPIIQVTDCSHINYFGAGGHVFAGGIGDCSANVVIKGDLNVSGDVSFTKNPIITNIVDTIPRTLSTFGETMTIIETISGGYSVGQHDISFNSVIYSNVDNSANIFANSIIDFSNNQSYFKNSILEVYYSVPVNFLSGGTDTALTVSFKEIGGSEELFLDTRSIRNQLGLRTVVFGPQSFIFTDSSPDISYLGKQWNLNYDVSGSLINTNNGRLTIKQKSLI